MPHTKRAQPETSSDFRAVVALLLFILKIRIIG
jgi:hypothetical protein